MEITQSKITAIIAGLVLLGAGFSIWRTLTASSLKINLVPDIGLGQALVEETAKVVHDRGNVVAVITTGYMQPGTPFHTEWQTFQKELKKHAAITLAAPEIVAVDPNDPMPGIGCPIAAFNNILNRHGQADAIIFFMGLPDWSWLEAKGAIPPPITAKIIVLDPGAIAPKNHYDQYFKNEVVSELITGWGGSAGQVEHPKTPHEWFLKDYQIITPQNYESLPR